MQRNTDGRYKLVTLNFGAGKGNIWNRIMNATMNLKCGPKGWIMLLKQSPFWVSTISLPLLRLANFVSWMHEFKSNVHHICPYNSRLQIAWIRMNFEFVLPLQGEKLKKNHSLFTLNWFDGKHFAWQRIQCGKVILKIFRELNSSVKTLFWRENVVFSVKFEIHSVENREIHCHAKFFSSNQLRVNSFSKKLISLNFCEKMVAVKFRNFHNVRSCFTPTV